ncbi:hypothetical protein MsAm2_07980 [Methanolapillus ohkumae]|uniref:Uncharacterized protein n=1 Tax=Methanolapillus ohkumae TaxID=3028298 RepID=A0AA96V5Q7_9EURY|nr:hypothetical protein MsAm2_07980 [Methanosarcinaceae archaeon Am2]
MPELDFGFNLVMDLFWEISKIPRRSGQEEKIAAFLEKFGHE